MLLRRYHKEVEKPTEKAKKVEKRAVRKPSKTKATPKGK